MVKVAAIVAALAITMGCGGDRDPFVVSGLHVVPSHFDIHPPAIAWVIEATRDALAGAPNGVDWDPPASFRTHGAVLVYFDNIPGVIDAAVGAQFGAAIALEGGECWREYQILAHELLHYVAEFHMGVTAEDNAAHNVWVFGLWAIDNGLDPYQTMEAHLFRVIKQRWCDVGLIWQSQKG